MTTSTERPNPLCAAAGLMLGVLACGCGPSDPPATVSGTVKCGTQPLMEGTVLFEADGRACPGEITEGQFALTYNGQARIPPGRYRVSVVPPPAKTVADPVTTQLRSVSPVDERLYPTKYRNPDTSELSFDVQPGSNEFVITLEKTAKTK